MMQPTTMTDPAAAYPISTARQALYRFGSLSLLDPRVEHWSALADRQAPALLAEAAALLRNEIAERADGLPPLEPAKVLAALPESAEGLNAAYEHSFGLLVSSDCPPYRTEYIDRKFTFQRSQKMADIAGYYRAFGLQPSPDHPDRVDHAALILEFMAYLVAHERHGQFTRGPDADEVAVCHRAQVGFFEEHVASWIPTFGRLLTQRHCAPFYRAVGDYLVGLVAYEAAWLGVEARCARPLPTIIESPDECEGCGATCLD